VFRAILFDLDGTLVDSERECAEAMARALERGRGLRIDQADRDFIVGRSWVDIHRQLAGRYPAMTWTMAELIAATAAAREEVIAERGITILPGAVEAVRRFAHLGLAIVTGSSRVEAAQSLAALGLADRFAVVVASEDVPRSKPAPDGYLAAAAALGVAPSECLGIEDSAHGIAAGHAAGARVLAVRAGNYAGHDQSAAHHVIDSLEELGEELLAALHR
jgi:HAD superfamily hydrolase (TIGR01509 family)